MKRSLHTLLLACVACTTVLAAELKPEERLQAIRQAMVDAAMKSHTLVSSSSWMDSKGALRELNRFSSEIKLRDLQVAEYSRDLNNQPQARLANAQVEKVTPACRAPQAKAPLRHVMSLGLDISPEFIQAQRYEAQQVGRFARAKLLQLAPQASHLQLMTEVVHGRAYERAMHGHGEEQVAWHLQLSLVPANYYTTEGKSAYALRWLAKSVSAPHTPLQGEVVLGITPPGLVIGTPKMDNDLMRNIHTQVASMLQRMDQTLACDPPTLVVQTNDQGHYTLRAGATAGLRVGDTLVLSDPRVLPQHALEVGALDGAVLAEVKSVSAYRSELKWVAGKAPKNQAGWVAWPYTY